MLVVLDHPQELMNIAHVVRAMKNFAIQDLRLVAPVEHLAGELRRQQLGHTLT